MTVDFKVYLQLKLVKAWLSFLKSIPTPTEFMLSIYSKLTLHESDIAININRFQCAWIHIKSSLPNLLLKPIIRIDSILQIWDDFHLIDKRLEEIDV
jgi:hypothetical protein